MSLLGYNPSGSLRVLAPYIFTEITSNINIINTKGFLPVVFRSSGFLSSKDLSMIWISNSIVLNAPDESYSRNECVR